MRDNYSDAECRLDLSGSDPCEIFVSINGHWIGNHHTYSFMDMKRNLNNMTRLQLIRANPDGPVLRKAHKKQENVWFRQYDKSEYVENLLTTYPGIGDEKSAWDEGVNLAQNDLRTVGVCPSDNDESEEWFYSPHKCHENLVEMIASEDDLEGCENAGDEEVLENDDNIGENWVGHCQETFMKILLRNETIEKVKISPTVDVPGYGAQYKSTIVRLLNGNPKLSNDRLVRVRQNATQASGTEIHAGRHYVSLFEDYAYVSNGVVKVGKAQKMRKKFQKGHTEYRNPVDIRDKENVSVSVILKPYQLRTLELNELYSVLISSVSYFYSLVKF